MLTQNKLVAMIDGSFIKGRTMDLQMACAIFDDFSEDPDYSYISALEEARGILRTARIKQIENVVFIKTDCEMVHEVETVLIRYFNMCHQDKKLIIAINGMVAYVPDAYQTVGVKSLFGFKKGEISYVPFDFYQVGVKKVKGYVDKMAQELEAKNRRGLFGF